MVGAGGIENRLEKKVDPSRFQDHLDDLTVLVADRDNRGRVDRAVEIDRLDVEILSVPGNETRLLGRIRGHGRGPRLGAIPTVQLDGGRHGAGVGPILHLRTQDRHPPHVNGQRPDADGEDDDKSGVHRHTATFIAATLNRSESEVSKHPFHRINIIHFTLFVHNDLMYILLSKIFLNLYLH